MAPKHPFSMTKSAVLDEAKHVADHSADRTRSTIADVVLRGRHAGLELAAAAMELNPTGTSPNARSTLVRNYAGLPRNYSRSQQQRRMFPHEPTLQQVNASSTTHHAWPSSRIPVLPHALNNDWSARRRQKVRRADEHQQKAISKSLPDLPMKQVAPHTTWPRQNGARLKRAA